MIARQADLVDQRRIQRVHQPEDFVEALRRQRSTLLEHPARARIEPCGVLLDEIQIHRERHERLSRGLVERDRETLTFVVGKRRQTGRAAGLHHVAHGTGDRSAFTP
jgi:hypothetical protein